MIGHPSAAALLLPGYDVPRLVEAADAAFRAAGYVRRDAPPPRGYPVAQGEWLGFVATAARESAVGLLLAEDLASVFTSALVLSRALPDQPLVAWRRFRGANPVMKLFHRGRPQWKDGEDPDLEVGWDVPHAPPAGVVRAEDLGLPGRAGDVSGDFESVLRSYADALAEPLPHEQRVGWVERRSRLAV